MITFGEDSFVRELFDFVNSSAFDLTQMHLIDSRNSGCAPSVMPCAKLSAVL
jgi:hypothetical protein